MPRKPADHQFEGVVKGLIDDLRAAITVVPLVAEHVRLEERETSGGLPTSRNGGGEKIDDAYSGPGDPTGETAIRPLSGDQAKAAAGAEALRTFTHHLVGLVGATRAVLDQAPAATMSVNKGRAPTDGRSQAEYDQRKYVHAMEAESTCQACGGTTSEVGRLKAGLCHTDYNAWHRARTADPAADRHLWLLDRRQRLAEQAEEATGEVGEIIEGPWGQARRAA